MALSHATWVELLKYPVLVLSIVLALLVLKFFLGLEFGVITEVSTTGVKFSQQSHDTLVALAELETRVNEMEVRVNSPDRSPDSVRDSEMDAQDFAAGQAVSDALAAAFTRLQEDFEAEEGHTERGFIWIGNYSDGWDPVKLSKLDTGQPMRMPPSEIVPGTEYRVLGNMVLRDGLPANDEEYFRGRANLGVIPRGTRVSVARAPVGINRGFATQFWMEVDVMRD